MTKLYLTFDDGTHPKGTPNLLDAAKEFNIPISFFIVGKNVFNTPLQTSLWEQLKTEPNMQLCNHSFTHGYPKKNWQEYYEYPEQVEKDILDNKERPGFNNTIARMPFLNAWRTSHVKKTVSITEANPPFDRKKLKIAADLVHAAGFSVLGWDYVWEYDDKTFVSTKTGEQVFLDLKRIKKTETPGHIVMLAHDQQFQHEAEALQLQDLFRRIKKDPELEPMLASSYPGV